MSITVMHGDMREVLAAMEPESFHSVVTDPPYHLTSIVKRFGGANAAPAQHGTDGAFARASRGFMGKQWDGGNIAFQPETWAEVLRVMKPGAHLVAFGGTRTYHRMACAIEDAGFEIKDTLMYLFGSGFPKSHNLDKHLKDDQRCLCHRNNVSYRNEKERGADQSVVSELRKDLDSSDTLPSGPEQGLFEGVCGGIDLGIQTRNEQAAADAQGEIPWDMHSVPSDILSQHEMDGAHVCDSLLAPMQRCSARSRVGEARSERRGGSDACGTRQVCPSHDRRAQPGVEGRCDASSSQGQLRSGPLPAVSTRPDEHGSEGWLCDAAPSGDGPMGRTSTAADRVCSPQGSRPAEQRAEQSGTLAGQPQSQNGGAWPLCSRCGKPRIPEGFGTALKPAVEPIILARKPLAGTVAANVLRHGTGALNIDACRIPGGSTVRQNTAEMGYHGGNLSDSYSTGSDLGRWPANVLHDGSDEVEAAFAVFGERGGQLGGQSRAGAGERFARQSGNFLGGVPGGSVITADSGTASRFFYTAKADASDRLASKHPTVKPVSLIRYLVKLITPPGGHVLDCFAGSGTTGMAAMAEGYSATLVEREGEYVADIKRRLAHVHGHDTPMFAEIA